MKLKSIFRLFFHFASAFLFSVWWKLSGYEVIASAAAQRERTASCNWCPYREQDVCTVCGCITVSKITLSAEKCPRSYWLREKVAAAAKPNDC